MTPATATGPDAHPSPSATEHEQRWRRVQSALVERGLDALLVTRPQNVYYLTGFRSLGAGLAGAMGHVHGVLIPAAHAPTLFIRALERRTADRYATVEAEPYSDDADPYELIARRLAPGTARIGIESLDLTDRQARRLERACGGVALEDASQLVDRMRRVKSPEELVHVREASRLANLGLRRAIDAARDGVRVSAVVSAATRAMYEAGQDDVSWPPVLVWSGPEGGLMHDTALDGLIETGHLVTIEVTGSCHLYASDAMATISIGAPSDALTAAYADAVAVHDAARGALRAGAAAEAAHAAADRAFRAAGHGPYYRRVGGAIGINAQPSLFFEGLSLVRGETTPLEQGMTVLVQPGVDRPAMMIVASTNLVTSEGYEELTEPLDHLETR